MAPAASFEHGESEIDLGSLFRPIAHTRGLKVGGAFNLGSNGNFRVPDMGVHRGQPSGVWLETAAIVVEVRSPDDETYDKFDFYFEHDVDELLITDLVSHEVQWYHRGDDGFVRADSSDVLGLTNDDVRRQLRW